MGNNYKIYTLTFFCTLLIVISCESQQQTFSSPPGYDFSKPRKYKMPFKLREISGIAFNKGISDTVYAEEDEDGKVFHFKLGDAQVQVTRFWKKGDFEDISICNNQVIMLRSDGVLFTFPLSETAKPETDKVKVFEGLLPAGEYEGLASIDSGGKLFVLCKHCYDEKTRKWGGGFIFHLNAAGDLTAAGEFEINIKEIDAITNSQNIRFHPSALAYNSGTREWFILSSVNHMLVITDEEWKVKTAYPLNPSIFPQPEGIAFDGRHNLYISNERNLTPAATILAFDFKYK